MVCELDVQNLQFRLTSERELLPEAEAALQLCFGTFLGLNSNFGSGFRSNFWSDFQLGFSDELFVMGK